MFPYNIKNRECRLIFVYWIKWWLSVPIESNEINFYLLIFCVKQDYKHSRIIRTNILSLETRASLLQMLSLDTATW